MSKKKRISPETLDADSDVEDFPIVWDSDDTMVVDASAVINKHVYLAMCDIVQSAHFICCEVNGKQMISVSVCSSENLWIETQIEDLIYDDHTKNDAPEWGRLAEAFETCAKRARKNAELCRVGGKP
mgnify:CR=1 FL=1|tara:strand:- start:599 stop:979 length:381 start_codon:yes stop_codon:yes gene_type:complete